MSYKVLSKLRFPWSNSIIRNLLIYDVLPHLISKYIAKSLSKLSSLELLSLQKSSPKNILDLIKSFSSLVYYYLPFAY